MRSSCENRGVMRMMGIDGCGLRVNGTTPIEIGAAMWIAHARTSKGSEKKLFSRVFV